MHSDRAAQLHQLKSQALQELHSARDAHNLAFSPIAPAQDRPQAQARYRDTVYRISQEGVLTPAEITHALQISRSYYYKLTTSAPTLPANSLSDV
jgi:hypothetical protein